MPDALPLDDPFAATTPRLALPLLHAAQARKEAFLNEALARLDGLVQPSVAGYSATPPTTPADGECWIVAAPAEGDWASHEDRLALRQQGQWLFVDPRPGMLAYDASLGQFRWFSRTWQKAEQVEEPFGGLIVDSEARAAIGALISALRAAGICPSA